jgi:hypothetical protein
MKLITVMVEQASVEGLSAGLPRAGVASVTISEVEGFEHTTRRFRVELLVEDHAVHYVMAGFSFAVSAGLIGQCKGAWITPAQELVEMSSAAERLVSA